jgi:hypothetical protein
MGWQFRKSKKFGPARFTLSHRGLSSSFGAGPFRLSFGADGRTRRTLRIPGTGLYNIKTIGGRQQSRPTRNSTGSNPILMLILLAAVVFLLGSHWRTMALLLGICLIFFVLFKVVNQRNAREVSNTPMAVPPAQVETQLPDQHDLEGSESGLLEGPQESFRARHQERQ